jgi:hypothetical protein
MRQFVIQIWAKGSRSYAPLTYTTACLELSRPLSSHLKTCPQGATFPHFLLVTYHADHGAGISDLEESGAPDWYLLALNDWAVGALSHPTCHRRPQSEKNRSEDSVSPDAAPVDWQVTGKENRVRHAMLFPMLPYLLLLRLYGSELEADKSFSMFTLKHRFMENAFKERIDQSEHRWRKKLDQLRVTA